LGPSGGKYCNGQCDVRDYTKPPPPVSIYVNPSGTVPSADRTSPTAARPANADRLKLGPTDSRQRAEADGGGDDDGISVARNLKLGLDAAELLWPHLKDKALGAGLKLATFYPTRGGFVEVDQLVRLSNGSRVIKLANQGGEFLGFVGKHIITPFMAGYDGAEMVDMMRQGREDDAFTSFVRLGGDLVPPLHLMNILTDDFRAIVRPERDFENFAPPQRFDNNPFTSPGGLGQFPAQSLQRELPAESAPSDYIDPFGS